MRFALCVIAFLAAACTRAPQEIVLSGPTMGTTYTVKAVAPPEDIDARAIRIAIDDVLAQIDRQMSGYRPDSHLSQFNSSATVEWVEAPATLATVVDLAQKVSLQSGGAFDVTVAPLVEAWGFGVNSQPRDLPDEEALAVIRERVGFDKLQVRAEPPALRKLLPALTVDLNGVAPGYAVDTLAERLRAMRVQHFMIEIGGEVRTAGRNVRGELWRVAIERPVDTAQSPYAVVELDGMAVTTSGEYRHSYERDGQRYSHTIDPRTGRPVTHDLASVVVIGESAARIDAWATALNVLGPEEGYALATKLDLAALFIERRGDTLTHRVTKRFAPHVVSFYNDSEGQP